MLFALQHLFEFGARHRTDRLEAAHMAEAVIGGEQAVHSRGAGPHRADDDDRPLHRAGEDFGMTREPPLRQQAIAQHVMELFFRRELARRIEARFGVDRLEQHVERAFEPGIAEIVEPGGRARFGHQMGFLQPRRIDQPQSAPRFDGNVQTIDESRPLRRVAGKRFRRGLQVCSAQSAAIVRDASRRPTIERTMRRFGQGARPALMQANRRVWQIG